MDIVAIKDAIEELESSDTTVSNVKELAALYIVQDKLETRAESMVSGQNKELFDIIPEYKKYCNIKRQFQQHTIPEEAVVDSISQVCRELQEFIQTLYCNTDLRKERLIIESVLSSEYIQFCQK